MALSQGVVVIVICLIAGFRPEGIAALPFAFVYMALIGLMFTALGTSIAALLSDFQGFQLVMNFLVMPIFFLSCAYSPWTTSRACWNSSPPSTRSPTALTACAGP